MITEAVDGLLEAIRLQHPGCEAVHETSAEVSTTLDDGSTWTGVVHAFGISGHSGATRAFAWYRVGPRVERVIFNRAATTRDMFDMMQEIREETLRSHPVVLALPPVMTAGDAVRTALTR